MNIAIVVVTYNRNESLRRLINSLIEAEYDNYEVTLIISIDKSENKEVYKVAHTAVWPYGEKIVVEQEENLGLKRHVLKCGDLVYDYDAIIMLEDDLYVSKSFFIYSLKTLDFYANDTDIAGISLYSYNVIDYSSQRTFSPLHDGSDVYFMQVPSSWGQIWTRGQWSLFRKWLNDNHEEIYLYKNLIPEQAFNWGEKSWKRLFYIYIAKENKYIVYPRDALSTNMSEIGTHNKMESTTYQVGLVNGLKRYYSLVQLSNSKSKYDSFFESKNIMEYLSENNTVVDFYNLKNNQDMDQSIYVITTKVINRKIVKSWGLNLKPYELNIIKDIPGNDIFLYDMSIEEKNKNKDNIDMKLIRYELPGVSVRSFGTIIRIKLERVIRFVKRKLNFSKGEK